MIDPEGANCGGGVAGPSFVTGVDANNDDDFDDEGDTAPTGSVPADVAAGYSDLLEKFVAVYGAPGGTTGGTARALQDANKALSDAIERGLAGAALTTYESAITRAQEAHNKAMAAFTNVSAGPINQAGVAEWMAKAAVTQSVADYNKQVGVATTAKGDLDDLDYGSYVPLGNPELVGETGVADRVVTIDANGKAMINPNELIQYVNGDLDATTPQVATVSTVEGMIGVTDTDESNFDAAGNLIVPMELDSDTGDDLEDLRSVVDSTNNGVDMIRTRVEQVNAAAAALKEARDDYTGVNQDVYDEAYRRAQAEADYLNAQWAKVLSDNTDMRTAQQKLKFVDEDSSGINEAGETTVNDSGPNAYEENPITIAGYHADYTTESNKRFNAEQDLRATVAAREAATAHARSQFNSPQSFYEQLVAGRQAKKVAADRAVASASEDGATPAESLTDTATAAAEALADAQEAQVNLQGLFVDEDDPTVALINELIKTGGDDGQALVDAISATYETAAGAADAAREVVAELTGEGGAVSVNTADIETLDGRVTVSEGAILANAGNITMNAAGILANRTDIDTNTAGIATNVDSIIMNAGNIMDNRGMIETNTMGISGNSGRIDAAESMISQNQGNISGNTAMIGELSESLEVVRAGVAASMALAGMPAINGRGISIGVGSFDGESAFAIGFQIQNEATSFKVGLTSGGGATGASAGVGFQF